MGNKEKGVVVWETPAPHSMPWCRVQLEFAHLGSGLYLFQGMMIPLPSPSSCFPYETSLRLLCWVTPPVSPSTARLCGCFWNPICISGWMQWEFPAARISAGCDALRGRCSGCGARICSQWCLWKGLIENVLSHVLHIPSVTGLWGLVSRGFRELPVPSSGTVSILQRDVHQGIPEGYPGLWPREQEALGSLG